MQFAPYISFLAVMAALTLAACQNTAPVTQEPVRYYGVQTRLLDNDLVQFHVRTRIGQQADRLSADAVYTISRSLPQGTKTIDAEVVADACARDNIPMV